MPPGPEKGAERHTFSRLAWPGSCGLFFITRVDQLASDVRVPPQLPIAPLRYSSSVQVCAMYSEASQIDCPSVTAAP